MRHPPNIWTEPTNADYPLKVLWDTYAQHLAGQSKPASPSTIRKHQYTLVNFQRSLEFVTPAANTRWHILKPFKGDSWYSGFWAREEGPTASCSFGWKPGD